MLIIYWLSHFMTWWEGNIDSTLRTMPANEFLFKSGSSCHQICKGDYKYGAYARERDTKLRSISSKQTWEFNPPITAQMVPSSPIRMKTSRHARSISFPSRTHPLLPQFNEHVNRLKETEFTSNSLSSLGDTLSDLQDLYVYVDELIHMPHIQQSLTLVQESNKKLADEVLDTYIKILDACTSTKDIFSHAKYDVQELLSALQRRKDATDASGKYLANRRKDKKTIQKALKGLKNVKISERDDQLEAIDLFNNVQSATVSVLKSSLTYVMGTKTRSSLVSKLIRTECKGTNKNEFDQINEALGLLDIESIQRQLEDMEFKIQDIEEGLEYLFKHLIKTRVLLLNMLSY